MNWKNALLVSAMVLIAGSESLPAGTAEAPPAVVPDVSWLNVPSTGPWQTKISALGGWRYDYFRWKVVFPQGSGVGNSALTWRGLNSLTTGFQAETLYKRSLYLSAEGSFGGGISGVQTDSDYYNGQEYSQSVSSAQTSKFWEAAVMAGWRFYLLDNRVTITPIVGTEYNYAWLTIQGGHNNYDSSENLSGLNSNYRPNVLDGFLGTQVTWNITSRLRATGDIHLGLGYYYARAKWNERTDLSQPLSFIDQGLAWTLRGSVGLEYLIARNWTVYVKTYYRGMFVYQGKDTTYFSSGGSLNTTLSNITWNTLGVNAGIGVQF